MDPRSYSRYDGAANVVQSLSAPAVAALFEELKPLLQDVCQESGCRGAGLRQSLIQAIDELLRTPVVQGDIRLRKKIKSYPMADSKLEKLSAVQKHLIRMGPANTAKIQGKLREIALALGVPQEQLPKAQIYRLGN